MQLRHAAIASLSLALSTAAYAQAAPKKAPKAEKAPKDSFPVPRLYRETAPLAVTLTANFGKLKDDRDDKAPYRSATISYVGDSGKTVKVPLRVKTHGIWRLKHCDMPPLRWNFTNKDVKGTLFHDVENPKMVSACKNNDKYEQLVLQEFQLYRVYQLVTPMSHRARLLKITYADSATGRVEMARYAFVFEDPEELAARLHGKMNKVKGATADDLDPDAGALVYVFQYFIGNTDFSFNGLHNGELVLRPDGTPLTPIGYDFDFSGAVNAPYATPDPKLNIAKVRNRLFRGYCSFNENYPAAFDQFKERKADIYALYSDAIGKLMDADVVKSTLEYYDEFYESTKDANSRKRITDNGCVRQR